jgi:hypothetical protein
LLRFNHIDMRRLLLLAALLVSLSAFADESPLVPREPAAKVIGGRHYILSAARVLRDDDRDALAERGVEIQAAMPGSRYLVRAAANADLSDSLLVRSLDPITAAHKLHASAIHAAANATAGYVRVSIMFHKDTAYDDAQRAIVAAGGSTVRPLAMRFEPLHRVTAQVPLGTLQSLAADERVLGIFGPLPKIKTNNAQAAVLSHVNIIQAAPYGLTGNGVQLSLFELSAPDNTHPEFGGRLDVSHFKGTYKGEVQHSTHVSGTMIASGIDPRARGMEPNATLHAFEACNDCDWLTAKQQDVPKTGSVADNNSWGFTMGWWNDDPDAGGMWTWVGSAEYFGAYEILAAALDSVARCSDDDCKIPAITLFVHSSGNEADKNGPSSAPFPHRHQDNNGATLKTETFCYSANGSGTDCPANVCTAGNSLKTGEPHCETARHPPNGPYTSLNFVAASKNTVAVGAIDVNGEIASFSSRGPTRDGRVKPDVVAKGVNQFSTLPSNSYGSADGTSMSSPVVTGISGLLVQQWRKTFNAEPMPWVIKGLLIAGTDDLGNPGPDFTYGFGLVNAKTSADLIINDATQGKRLRIGTAKQGDTIEIPFAVTQAGKARVVLTWQDPEVVFSETQVDDISAHALLNDLDLTVVGPDGSTTLPYVLNASTPTAFATRGRNTVDNTEMVEIPNAVAGNYKAVVNAREILSGSTQQFVVLTNEELGATVATCADATEPNDSEAAAYGPLASSATVVGRICSSSDTDFFKFHANNDSDIRISVTTHDTPVRVTITGGNHATFTQDIAANTTVLLHPALLPILAPRIAIDYSVRVAPTGTVGTDGRYELTPVYTLATSPRRRTTR